MRALSSNELDSFMTDEIFVSVINAHSQVGSSSDCLHEGFIQENESLDRKVHMAFAMIDIPTFHFHALKLRLRCLRSSTDAGTRLIFCVLAHVNQLIPTINIKVYE